MKKFLLPVGFIFSIFLSLYIGYREGMNKGFQYTEKINDVDHATGLMRSDFERAEESYMCLYKIHDAENNGGVASLKIELKDSFFYSVDEFEEQVKRIRRANIYYPLADIYQKQINKMAHEISEM